MNKDNSKRLIRWPQVGQMTGICRSHAHALAAEDKFPKPIKIGERASAWLASDIQEWIETKVSESRGGA